MLRTNILSFLPPHSFCLCFGFYLVNFTSWPHFPLLLPFPIPHLETSHLLLLCFCSERGRPPFSIQNLLIWGLSSVLHDSVWIVSSWLEGCSSGIFTFGAHSIRFSFIVEVNFGHLAKIVSSLFIIKLLYSLHLRPISSLQWGTLRTERTAFPLKPSLKHGGHWWFLPDCLYWPRWKMISFPTPNSSLHLSVGIQHVFIIKKKIFTCWFIRSTIYLSLHPSQ